MEKVIENGFLLHWNITRIYFVTMNGQNGVEKSCAAKSFLLEGTSDFTRM